MRTLFLTVTVFLALTTASVNAQDIPVKWGKFSDDELAMSEFPEDPEANAVVLCDYGKVEFILAATTRPVQVTRHKRIKLLNDNGIDQFGNISIDYYTKNNYSVVTSLRAQVVLPNGEEIKVEKSQMFEEEINEYWSTVRIACPALEPGAIIEYRYTIESEDILQPVDWYFQGDIPVILSHLYVQFPGFFQYVRLTQGEHDVATEEIVSPRGEVMTTFVAKDVPALREEKFITRMEDYYTRVRYQLSSYNIPGGSADKVLHSWDELALEMRYHELFGKVYRNKSQGRKLLEESGIDPASGNQFEVAKQIYQYIGANVSWDNSHRFLANGSVNQMLKDRSAGSGGLNLMLLCALQAAEIEAAPVMTSIRTLGRTFELYPFVDQFNHTLVLANLDGKEYLMDVSNTYRPLGWPRLNSLNYRGWLVGEDVQGWIDLDVQSSKSTYYAQLVLTEDGICEGTLQTRFEGYPALDEREKYFADQDAYTISDLSTDAGKAVVTTTEVAHAKDLYEPLTCTYDVELPQFVAGGDIIYFSIPVRENWKENPFKKPERKFPIEMNYPFEEQYITVLDIPAGYFVEELPSSLRMLSEDGGLAFERSASESNGKIQVRMKFTVSRLRFATDRYASIRQFFDEVVQKIGEQIVLKRSN